MPAPSASNMINPDPVYINDHTKATTATHRLRTAQNTSAYLIPHLKSNSRILDVGCGPGTISIGLARLVPEGSVVAMDYTAEPVEETQNLAEQEGLSNVQCIVGDVHALMFEDDTFDVVHVSQVLQHLADPTQALREMRRVVKTGGIVAARESAHLSWYPEYPGIRQYWDVSAKIAKDSGGNPHPGARIHVWAREAGFDRLSITKSAGTWCYSSDDERKAWGDANASRCNGTRFAIDAVKKSYCDEEDFEKMVNDWHRWVEDEDGWFAILHGEILCWK